MAALREEMERLLTAPESFDPEDLDTFGDATIAGSRGGASRKASGGDPELAPAKGRLRLRAPVPELPGYSGKKVSREDAFGEADSPAPVAKKGKKRKQAPVDDFPIAAPSEDDEEPMAIGGASAGGFSISGELEKEYEKMMSRTKHELEVMRRPAEAEVERRRKEAAALKAQLEAWKALVELRIHFESCLSMGHRLPAADAAATSPGSASVSGPADSAAAEVRGLLGSLLGLQETLSRRCGNDITVGEGAAGSAGRTGGDAGEAAAWSFIDARVQSTLDWSIGVADEWKEKTRLDARRSFKVLDQSLRTQMQAAADMEPAKLRRRSIPPPGRHKVIGIAPAKEDAADTADGENNGDGADSGERDIFDDRDFYVSLLREVLADGQGGGKDALGGADASGRELRDELQGRRANKKKSRPDVERRASKGRKIRYVPIEKLQNFMAPQPRPGGDVASGVLSGEAAVDALLRSLFA